MRFLNKKAKVVEEELYKDNSFKKNYYREKKKFLKRRNEIDKLSNINFDLMSEKMNLKYEDVAGPGYNFGNKNSDYTKRKNKNTNIVLRRLLSFLQGELFALPLVIYIHYNFSNIYISAIVGVISAISFPMIIDKMYKNAAKRDLSRLLKEVEETKEKDDEEKEKTKTNSMKNTYSKERCINPSFYNNSLQDAYYKKDYNLHYVDAGATELDLLNDEFYDAFDEEITGVTLKKVNKSQRKNYNSQNSMR